LSNQVHMESRKNIEETLNRDLNFRINQHRDILGMTREFL